MSKEWIDEELENADLGDQRLNERFAEFLAAMSERPNVSIPTACGGHSETIAAYRFFDNEKTTFEKIMSPHYEKTRQRIAAQDVVLLVQDSSEIDLTKPVQQIRGAGRIGNNKDRRGAILHLLESFVPDGTPLGAVWSKIMIRPELDEQEQLERATRTKTEKKKIERLKSKRPIEEKESFRWVEALFQQYGAKRSKLPNNIPKRLACASATVNRIFSRFLQNLANPTPTFLSASVMIVASTTKRMFQHVCGVRYCRNRSSEQAAFLFEHVGKWLHVRGTIANGFARAVMPILRFEPNR
jgi:hypothetical protein